jgi:hypothetical protein
LLILDAISRCLRAAVTLPFAAFGRQRKKEEASVFRNRLWTVLAGALLAAQAMACGGDSTGPAGVAVVVVRPTSQTLTSLGQTQQFTAEARDAIGNELTGKTFTWSSTNTAVVEITAGGLATAQGNGIASVRASTEGVTGEAEVTVEQAVASVVVDPASVQLTALQATRQLAATALDALGSPIAGATFEWSSSQPAVATVGGSGLVTAIANGTTVIVAEAGGESDSCNVLVNQVAASVRLVPASATMLVGDNLQFDAIAEDANGYPLEGEVYFIWSVFPLGIVSVAQSGFVVAEQPGAALVRATEEQSLVYGEADVSVIGTGSSGSR